MLECGARPPRYRFDDPLGEYGVCYLGRTQAGAFAETFLRNPPVRLVERVTLENRSLAELAVRLPLRLVRLTGRGLARLGTTSAVSSTPDCAIPQRWSRALWSHPARPDGLLYRSRHDDAAVCVALFDRAVNRLRLVESVPWLDRPRRLRAMLDRYDVGLA